MNTTEAIKAAVQSALDSIHAVEADLGWTDDIQSAIRQLNKALSALSASAEQQPVAWAVFTANGNIRVWSTDSEPVRKLAAEEGLSLTPLYSAPVQEKQEGQARELPTGDKLRAIVRSLGGTSDRPQAEEYVLAGWKAAQSAPAPVESEAKDAQRYRWLRAEHDVDTPLGRVLWKSSNQRTGSSWANIIDGNDLDTQIDRAIAATAQQKGGE